MREDFVIEATFLIEAEAVRAALKHVTDAPDSMAISGCGQGERAARSGVVSPLNGEIVEQYLARHGGGFLYGKRFQIQVSLYDKIPSKLTVWATIGDNRLVRESAALIRMWDECGCSYAYGAAWSERRNRNGLKDDRGEDWAGRDSRRYVPGLYWLNYFSRDYRDRFEIDVSSLAQRTGGRIEPLTNGDLLTLYDRPEQWVAQNDKVRAVIEQTRNLFSISCINVPKNMTPREDLDWSVQLHQKWP